MCLPSAVTFMPPKNVQAYAGLRHNPLLTRPVTIPNCPFMIGPKSFSAMTRVPIGKGAKHFINASTTVCCPLGRGHATCLTRAMCALLAFVGSEDCQGTNVFPLMWIMRPLICLHAGDQRTACGRIGTGFLRRAEAALHSIERRHRPTSASGCRPLVLNRINRRR